MIDIDTNVLVRIFIKDNDIQTHKALTLIKNQAPVSVSVIVLCETIWVLQSRYDFNKHQLIEVIEKILKINQLQVEHSDIVWAALHEYQHTHADFSDCLIGAGTKLRGCDSVATFDKKAAKLKHFKLIQ